MLGLSLQLLRRSAGLTVTCFKNVKKRKQAGYFNAGIEFIVAAPFGRAHGDMF